LAGQQESAEEFRQASDRRRKLMVEELSKIDGVTVPTPQGAFYVDPDVQGLLGRGWGGRQINTSLELADYILDTAEVAVVPGDAFGPSGGRRLGVALGVGQRLEGVQRLQRLFAYVALAAYSGRAAGSARAVIRVAINCCLTPR